MKYYIADEASFDQYISDNNLQPIEGKAGIKEAAETLPQGSYIIFERVGKIAPKVAVKLNFKTERTRVSRAPKVDAETGEPIPAKKRGRRKVA